MVFIDVARRRVKLFSLNKIMSSSVQVLHRSRMHQAVYWVGRRPARCCASAGYDDVRGSDYTKGVSWLWDATPTNIIDVNPDGSVSLDRTVFFV